MQNGARQTLVAQCGVLAEEARYRLVLNTKSAKILRQAPVLVTAYQPLGGHSTSLVVDDVLHRGENSGPIGRFRQTEQSCRGKW